MSEMAKTMTLLGVAIVSMIAALVARPSSTEVDVTTLHGENLTKVFSDPDAAKQLRIVRFNEDTATLREFEVAEVDGLWSIPSKSGYPADAERQMAEAATCLMDREILSVASESAADHEQYGVIDPLSPKLTAGQKGVGTRVIMSDIHGEPLVDLIVGREVKDAEGQHYVREASRDLVYVIEIDPGKLSTDFEDWIEQDLLKINPWDLQEVKIKDYSVALQPVMSDRGFTIHVDWDRRTEMALGYSEQSGKWTAVKLREFDVDGREFKDFTLTEDEELNTATLDQLKNALDDLRIVDVVRKPAGLSSNLKAGEDFLKNPEAQQDLLIRGFTAVKTPEGDEEVISSEGEVICTMNDGAEYVLRFGDLQLTDGGGEQQREESADASEAKASEGVNRYLFVMARFNEDAVPKPELEALPELPEKASDESSETASDDTAAETTDESESDAETATDESPADEGASEAAGDDQLAKIIAERKRIEQENQRKLDRYQATLKQGREKVKELNARFGDWYYVISDDVFQKIHLDRDDVIQKKEKQADDNPASASEGAGGIGTPGSFVPGLPTIPGTGS